MARQDSGKLERFSAIFGEHKRMASDIDSFPVVLEGLGLGYVAFGIGGALGERRRTFTEFSLAAKVTKATWLDDAASGGGEMRVGYAGKLGDFGLGAGSWAEFEPAKHEALAKPKVIMSDEIDGKAMFERFVKYAAAGDRKHDAESAGGAVPPLLCRDDALGLVAVVRRLCAADSFAQYDAIRTTLLGYADKVEAAAGKLPSQMHETAYEPAETYA